MTAFVANEGELEQACAHAVAGTHKWIEKENPAAAGEFIEAAAALGDLLGAYPGMGSRTDQPGVSMFPLVRYRYLIYYKVLKGEEVRIFRVRHASRKRPT